MGFSGTEKLQVDHKPYENNRPVLINNHTKIQNVIRNVHVYNKNSHIIKSPSRFNLWYDVISRITVLSPYQHQYIPPIHPFQ